MLVPAQQYQQPFIAQITGGTGPYNWREVWWDDTLGEYVKVDGGRDGVGTAEEINGGDVSVDSYQILRFRTIGSDGQPLYEFSAGAGGSSQMFVRITENLNPAGSGAVVGGSGGSGGSTSGSGGLFPCSLCSNNTPASATITASGFTGLWSDLNGTWTLNYNDAPSYGGDGTGYRGCRWSSSTSVPSWGMNATQLIDGTLRDNNLLLTGAVANPEPEFGGPSIQVGYRSANGTLDCCQEIQFYAIAPPDEYGDFPPTISVVPNCGAAGGGGSASGGSGSASGGSGSGASGCARYRGVLVYLSDDTCQWVDGEEVLVVGLNDTPELVVGKRYACWFDHTEQSVTTGSGSGSGSGSGGDAKKLYIADGGGTAITPPVTQWLNYRSDCINGRVNRFRQTIKLDNGQWTVGGWEFDSFQGCCECAGSVGSVGSTGSGASGPPECGCYYTWNGSAWVLTTDGCYSCYAINCPAQPVNPPAFSGYRPGGLPWFEPCFYQVPSGGSVSGPITTPSGGV